MSQLSLFEFEIPTVKSYSSTKDWQQGKVRFLAKSDLSKILGCKTNAFIPRIFSKAFVQSEEGLGMTLDEYHRAKIFTFEQTKRIIKYLQLDPEEMGL